MFMFILGVAAGWVILEKPEWARSAWATIKAAVR